MYKCLSLIEIKCTIFENCSEQLIINSLIAVFYVFDLIFFSLYIWVNPIAKSQSTFMINEIFIDIVILELFWIVLII